MTSVRSALREGDLRSFVAKLHPRAEWTTAADRQAKHEGREAVAAALKEERAKGVCIDPTPVIDHQAVVVVKLRPDSPPQKSEFLDRVIFIHVQADQVRWIEDFEDRESALERAGALVLSCPADPDWIATLCEYFGVEQRQRIEDIARLIQRPEVPAKYGIGRRELIADSLGALRVTGVGDTRSLLDIGSGYGFPGLVLGSVLQADVSLAEIAPERCEFLRRAVREMGLRNVEVVESPAEQLAREAFDVVTVRNVADLNTVVEWAAPHVRVGGTALIWNGGWFGRDRAAEADAAAAAKVTGLEFEAAQRTHPWAFRYVLVYRKVRETPPGFPRPLKETRRHPISVRDAHLTRDPVTSAHERPVANQLYVRAVSELA